MSGLAPLSPAGPGQPIDTERPDLMALLSDEAKAIVLAELVDMRAAAMRGNGGKKKPVLIDADNAIRRVARGLYRYERRVDPAAPAVDFDPTDW